MRDELFGLDILYYLQNTVQFLDKNKTDIFMYTNVWLITEGNTTLILKQEVLTKRLNSKLLVLWRFISNSSQEGGGGLELKKERRGGAVL